MFPTSDLTKIITQAFLAILRDLGLPLNAGRFDLNSLVKQSGETIDARLEKLDEARDSLQLAISAIDDLEKQAERQKVELSNLIAASNDALRTNDQLAVKQAALHSLANLDTKAVREALQVPSRLQRWLERGFSFIIGVAASIIASIVYAHL